MATNIPMPRNPVAAAPGSRKNRPRPTASNIHTSEYTSRRDSTGSGSSRTVASKTSVMQNAVKVQPAKFKRGDAEIDARAVPLPQLPGNHLWVKVQVPGCHGQSGYQRMRRDPMPGTSACGSSASRHCFADSPCGRQHHQPGRGNVGRNASNLGLQRAGVGVGSEWQTGPDSCVFHDPRRGGNEHADAKDSWGVPGSGEQAQHEPDLGHRRKSQRQRQHGRAAEAQESGRENHENQPQQEQHSVDGP